MPQTPIEQREEFIDDLKHCARCGANHDGLLWKPFINPVVDEDGTVWGWWTMCPFNNEPVLLAKVESEAK